MATPSDRLRGEAMMPDTIAAQLEAFKVEYPEWSLFCRKPI